MNIGDVIDSGYVVMCPEESNQDYYQSNVGIFVTERNARKLADRLTKWRGKRYIVCTVQLMIIDADVCELTSTK